MVAGRIVFARSYLLKANGVDRRSPLVIKRVDCQIFEMYRSHKFHCLTLVVELHKYNKKISAIKFPSLNAKIFSGKTVKKNKICIAKKPRNL